MHESSISFVDVHGHESVIDQTRGCPYEETFPLSPPENQALHPISGKIPIVSKIYSEGNNAADWLASPAS